MRESRDVIVTRTFSKIYGLAGLLSKDRGWGVDGDSFRCLDRMKELGKDPKNAWRVTQDDWKRLKGCRDENCRVAFYDKSRNRSRAWCSMEVCGNREKARSFRARHAVV